MAEGVGGTQFVAVVLQCAAVEEAIVRGSLATLAGGAGRVDALVVLVVPGVLVEHGGGQAQGLGGRVGDAGFQGTGAFGFQVVVGDDAATAGQHGFVQARAARGVGQAGVERHLFVQVIDGGNAGVDLAVGDFAAAGGAHLEVVVAQAGGEGDGVQVPDAHIRDLEGAQTDKSSISNIEIEFDIYDEEDSSREHFFNDKVTITPQ